MLIERLLEKKENVLEKDRQELGKWKGDLSEDNQKAIDWFLERETIISRLDEKYKEVLEKAINAFLKDTNKVIYRLLEEKENVSEKDRQDLEQLKKSFSDLVKIALNWFLEPQSEDKYKKELEELKESLLEDKKKAIDWFLQEKQKSSQPTRAEPKPSEPTQSDDNPSQPKELKTMQDVQIYFDRLNKALAKIKELTCYLPYLEKAYIETLCLQNNPYDFAETLEQAVDGTLHFEKEIEDPKTTFVLYYFHRRQLEEAASEMWFSTNKQIGRVWA